MTQPLTMKIHIREARPSDRTAIREITLAAYAQYEEPLGDVWTAYREDILRVLNNPAPALQLVAEQEGRVVGTGLVYPAGSTFALKPSSFTVPYPELRLLAVAPDSRGQGVALALMKEGVVRARASGAPGVMFHTTKLMRAEPLYARVGSFMRRREFDVQVAPEVIVEAYVMTFAEEPAV